jgi:hypothetical protein
MSTDSTNSLRIEIKYLHLELALKNQCSQKATEVDWEMMSILKQDLRDQVFFLKLLLKDKENTPLNHLLSNQLKNQ